MAGRETSLSIKLRVTFTAGKVGHSQTFSQRFRLPSLIDHLRDLILELGKGFAFVGNQYHLEIGGQDYFLDLLFYHLRLRCYVVIDLKIEEFRPEFAGKMNFYLSAVDDLLRYADDTPSIGLILCKEKNRIVVEYALRDTGKPKGVAQYRLTESLPERLQSELPTSHDLAGELPRFNLVTMRIRLERALQAIAEKRGLSTKLVGIAALTRALTSANAYRQKWSRICEPYRLF